MSTQTLSQRLRDIHNRIYLESQGDDPGFFNVLKAMEEAIAQAEAMEGKAGELVAWTSEERLEELAYRGAAGGMFRGNMGEVANIPLYRSPISPEARDRAIEALESIGNDAREVFDHGTSLLTVKAGTGRIIAVSDQALSALRGL